MHGSLRTPSLVGSRRQDARAPPERRPPVTLEKNRIVAKITGPLANNPPEPLARQGGSATHFKKKEEEGGAS